MSDSDLEEHMKREIAASAALHERWEKEHADLEERSRKHDAMLDEYHALMQGIAAKQAAGKPIKQVIDRLFAEQPRLKGDAEQAPAIECHVILAHQPQPLHGSLSVTPEGCYRMLTPATVNNEKSLLESFFDVDDIVSIMVVRPMSQVPPSIILGAKS